MAAGYKTIIPAVVVPVAVVLLLVAVVSVAFKLKSRNCKEGAREDKGSKPREPSPGQPGTAACTHTPTHASSTVITGSSNTGPSTSSALALGSVAVGHVTSTEPLAALKLRLEMAKANEGSMLLPQVRR